MFNHLLKGLWNRRRRNGLLILQILLSFLVLFAAFTFGSSSLSRFAAPLGFAVEDRVLVSLRFADGVDVHAPDTINGLPSPQQRLMRAVNEVQGVEKAAYVGWIGPFTEGSMSTANSELGFEMHLEIFDADQHYAEVMDVDVTDGRWFAADDTLNGRYPVVINRAFQQRYFPNSDLVDTTFYIGDETWLITGVVDHFKYGGDFAFEEPLVIFFRPDRTENLVVHLAPGSGPTVMRDLSAAVASITKSQESTIEPLPYLREKSNRAYWIPLILLGVTGLFLLTNVALGLFGVLINAIQQRRAEIGLRKALGSTGAQIGRLFTAEVLLLTAVALLLGTLLAAQIPLLDLVPVEGRYFVTGGVLAAGLILAIVLLCALVPSMRAARTAAAVALSEE